MDVDSSWVCDQANDDPINRTESLNGTRAYTHPDETKEASQSSEGEACVFDDESWLLGFRLHQSSFLADYDSRPDQG